MTSTGVFPSSAATSMRAMVVDQFGPPEVLRLKEIPRPQPDRGQVLVELQATGVNFADTERRRGVYAIPQLPWCPGSEGAGEVVAVGAGVEASWLGRRVAFWAMPPAVSGTYAEFALAPVEALFPLADSVPFDLGAALPLQGLTAYGLAYFAARIRPEMSVLVHAAAGGVGQILVQLLRQQGARVLATVSTVEKAKIVAALGAEAFLYGADLAERVTAATAGHGVDLVFDSIGRATQAQSLAMLAPYGELIHFGEASGPPQAVAPDDLYERSLKVGAFGLDTGRDPAAWGVARRQLLERVEQGELKISVSLRLPLEQAAQAHRLLEERATTGKVVLLPLRRRIT